MEGHYNIQDEPPSTGSAATTVGIVGYSEKSGGDISPRQGSERLSGRLLASEPRLQRALSQDSLSLKYKRMKCAVIVMATLMIIASMLLVSISLAMAEHIDELVRQMNAVSTTTQRPRVTTMSTTFSASSSSSPSHSRHQLLESLRHRHGERSPEVNDQEYKERERRRRRFINI